MQEATHSGPAQPRALPRPRALGGAAAATAGLAVLSLGGQLPGSLGARSTGWGDGVALLLAAGSLLTILLGVRYLASVRAELHSRARRDELTGLPNRAGFLAHLAAAVAEAVGGGPAVTLVLVGLELPRGLDDTFLAAVGPRLRRTLRADVTVGRLDSNRFGLLFRGDDEAGVDRGTERTLALMRRPVEVADRLLRPHAVAGRASCSAGTPATVADLVRDAETAMGADDAVSSPGIPPAQRPTGQGGRSADGAPPSSRTLLSLARTMLGMDLTFLSRIADGRQTFEAVDPGNSRLRVPEGGTMDAADGYCSRMLSGAVPGMVPDVAAHPVLGPLPVTRQLGVGAYCGVPVRLSDGTVYGTLCGLSETALEPVDGARLEALRVIAGLVGHALDAELRDALTLRIRREELQTVVGGRGRAVVLQPIVDLVDGRPRGYEALTRFRHPDGTSIPPDRVFAEARELGLLLDLERATASSALELLPRLPEDTYLSINFSPCSLLEPATWRLLAVAPDRVVVELTEHEQVTDYAAIRAALAPLRSRGLRLAVDDTGAGFASLQHLTELQPDVVKLDVAFVRAIDTDAPRRAVARAVAGYVAEVGGQLVAEGIETAEQAATLRKLGAASGQGWFFGRPESADELFGSPAASVVPLFPAAG